LLCRTTMLLGVAHACCQPGSVSCDEAEPLARLGREGVSASLCVLTSVTAWQKPVCKDRRVRWAPRWRHPSGSLSPLGSAAAGRPPQHTRSATRRTTPMGCRSCSAEREARLETAGRAAQTTPRLGPQRIADAPQPRAHPTPTPLGADQRSRRFPRRSATPRGPDPAPLWTGRPSVPSRGRESDHGREDSVACC
jgi:hypothetical protein